MTETLWKWAALMICRDPSLGDELAAKIAYDVDDAETFARAPSVTQNGQPAKFASVPLKSTGYAALLEATTDGPWPTLNAAGIPDEKIIAFKAATDILVGERAIRETQWEQFLADHGAVLVED